MEVTLLNFILVLITLIAFITNSLLIVFASKVLKKSKDIPLIIMIAAIEYFGPLPLIIDLIYSKFHDHGLIETKVGCNLSGTITSIVFFFEIALSAFLAVERLSLFVKLRTTKILFSYLTISCLIFASLLISSASTDGFTPTMSEFTCVLDIANSILSSFTYFYLMIITTINLVIIICCYYQITRQVNNTKVFIKLNHAGEGSLKHRSEVFQNAVVKIFTSLFIYGICMTCSIVAFFLEGVFRYPSAIENKGVSSVSHYAASLAFLIGIVMNSIVILFTHTGIASEAKKTSKSFKKLFIRN